MSIPWRIRSFNFFYFSLFSLFLSYLPVYGSNVWGETRGLRGWLGS